MAVVFLGLGSNLGNRCYNLLQSVAELSSYMEIINESSIIETIPMYEIDQPLFMNSAVQVETNLAPLALLKLNQSIERKMGRVENKRYGPRLVDIDILFYGDFVVNDVGLTIPHALIAERDFVLRPMAEIAPDFKCPVSHKTIREMLYDLNHISERQAIQ